MVKVRKSSTRSLDPPDFTDSVVRPGCGRGPSPYKTHSSRPTPFPWSGSKDWANLSPRVGSHPVRRRTMSILGSDSGVFLSGQTHSFLSLLRPEENGIGVGGRVGREWTAFSQTLTSERV